MNEAIKQKLYAKNEKLIDMVIERVKRDFPDDIDMIGLTGSFSSNDFYEKSDLDLIIVNNSDRGWEISRCFILGDVGYDVYCTPWDNLERKAVLDDQGISSLTELKVLYYAKQEHLDRFNALKEKALETLREPVGENCIMRAKKHLDLAKQCFADAFLYETVGAVRYASSNGLYHLVNTLVHLNNTCIKRGTKRYLEEILSYTHLPKDFEQLYGDVIDAKTTEEIQWASHMLLKSVVQLYDGMVEGYIEKPKPNPKNLKGTYEELWCNYRNKTIASTEAKNKSYAFLTACGAQNYLDEMTKDKGTKQFDVMQYFDGDNLEGFKHKFLEIMDEYLEEYEKVGLTVERYDTIETLREAFLNYSELS